MGAQYKRRILDDLRNEESIPSQLLERMAKFLYERRIKSRSRLIDTSMSLLSVF